MKSIERILVPTDFSDCANSAALTAIEMARATGATVTFMHIIEDTDSMMYTKKHVPNHEHEEKVGHMRANLNEWVLNAQHEGVEAYPLLILERSRSRIEEFVRKGKFNMIVMGSHGCSGIREWVLGSNAQNVVRHSPVPVLTVKTRSVNNLRNPLIASSFEPDVVPNFDAFVNLVSNWSPMIHLAFMNVIFHPRDVQRAHLLMDEFIARHPNVSFSKNIVDTNDVETGIHEFATELGAGVVCVSLEDDFNQNLLFADPIAEHLVNHEAVPVMVVQTSRTEENRHVHVAD